MKNNVTTSYLGNLNFFNRSGNSSSLIKSYHKENIKTYEVDKDNIKKKVSFTELEKKR